MNMLLSVLLPMLTVSYAAKDSIEKDIDVMIASLSVEEKVGQMTQIDLNIVVKGGYSNTDGTLDTVKLREAVQKWKVGSILNVVNYAYDLPTWHGLIRQIQVMALENSTPIPVIYGIDAIHGMGYAKGATLFPHNIGIAATRNPDMAERMTEVVANETKASGILWNFDPVLDIGRNPIWPRYEETFGEDPVIIRIMAKRIVETYERNDIASTIKHFLGYSNPRSGRDRTPAWTPEIEWREYELPQYREAVRAGASSVMINSAAVNGIPTHANTYLLTDVLRNELGFEGVIVSDWEDVNRLHERQGMAPTLKEAVRMAVLAGIDISMTPHDFRFAELLKELVEEDPNVAEAVDAAVRRILRLKHRVGLFENPFPDEKWMELFGKPEYAEVSRQAALESMTLLKNRDNSLPLDASKVKVLLSGPGAESLPALHGAWSYTWQGSNASQYPDIAKTVRQQFESVLGRNHVISVSNPNFDHSDNTDVSKLIASAASATHIVLVLGENAYAESPGSIQDLALDPKQVALAKAAAATGKPVIVVLTQGRPRIITPFVDDVDAILMAYRPGTYGASAIVDVLLGNYNPAGRLPFTYPRTHGDIVPYDLKWTEYSVEQSVGSYTFTGYNPLFEFGHGLSYTTFEYTDFELVLGSMNARVTVTNTGNRAGDDVVELYSRQLFGTPVPALRRLRAFERIHLKPGERKTVVFELTEADLATAQYGATNGSYEWKTAKGQYQLLLGAYGFTPSDQTTLPNSTNRPFEKGLTIHIE